MSMLNLSKFHQIEIDSKFYTLMCIITSKLISFGVIKVIIYKIYVCTVNLLKI